jgi:S-(hydroxymethyl)glutathione dehydrogenase/alcohol dehydrogenase
VKAAICYEINKPLVIEDGVTVEPPEADEVKIRIAATAICHSDLHFLKGDVPVKPPGLAGHESAGYIEEVGKDVTMFKPGDRVIVGPASSGCGHCYYCTIGYPMLCLNKKRPSEPRHKNKQGQRIPPWAGPIGGFAEYTTVSQIQVAKISKEIPIDRAALLACGVITGFGAVVNRAQVEPMRSVVVMGTGGVGLNAIQGAAFSGAHPVIAVDLLDNKLEAARTFGATHTINAAKEKDPVEAVKQLTYGRGADYVFITVGSIDALRQGFSMSGQRGMTVIVGIMQGNLSSFVPFEFLNERMLTGCGMGSTRLNLDIPMLVELYLSGRLKLDELITGRYPLEQINEAIDTFDKGKALRNVIMFE